MENYVEEAFHAFEAIEATTSRTQKENILASNKDNEALKQLLIATYNPFVVYGIKKDPKVKPEGTGGSYAEGFPHFFTLLEDLVARRLTGNNAVEAVQNYFREMDEREYKWYLRVLQRDLKIGITDKTINKIWKGLVPQFTCALANSFDPKKLPKEYVADTKFDGYRGLAFVYEDRVELRSRNGHLLEGYAGIESDYWNYMPRGFVYDGEIIARSNQFSDMQKSAFKKGESDKDGVHHVFDVVSIDEFESNNFNVPYRQRLAFLDQISDILDGARSLERVYPTRPLTNSEQDTATLFEYHTQNVQQDFEGTMVKDLNAVYKMDKSNNIMKIKDFYEIDLVVTGVYEGSEGTKYVGTMGGVTVELSDKDIIEQCPVNDPKHAKKLQYIPGRTFEVGVGSGWSDPERHEYWNNPNLIIGKTLQISFQETSLNKKGEHSLRFPTKVKVRDDK